MLSLSVVSDSGTPGSSVHGIFQARTLEWVAISFSSAWKCEVKVKLLSCVRLLATPWTAAHQAPPSMGFSRQEYWSGVPLPAPPTQHITLQCPRLKIHNLDELNLFKKEAVWIGCLLGGEWHNYTTLYEPRCSIRWVPSKGIKYFPAEKSLAFPRTDSSKERISTHSVFLGEFESETFWHLEGENTVLASGPKLAGSHPALSSTEYTHLRKTEPFHKGSCVNWWFSGWWVAYPYNAL